MDAAPIPALDTATLDALRAHAARVRARPLRDLAAGDAARPAAYAVEAGPLFASFARQWLDDAARDALFDLARRADLRGALQRLVDGAAVNATEGRAALHTALRGDASRDPVARAAHAEAGSARARMRSMVEAIRGSGVTDVVSIGIGGSDLGPRLVVDALGGPDDAPRVHFLSNVDGHAARRVLSRLSPDRTAAILVSKSFGTQETLLNGAIVREWMGGGAADDRLYAVSANVGRAAAAGVSADRILPMWDWVGGRYSLWSAVGLPIGLALGMDRFEGLLEGAAAFDRHALEAPLERNLAAWHALVAVWNRNVLGAASHAVLPYDERLRLLPAYLQQLVMESLGKSVRIDGRPVDIETVPVWWGGPGTDVQHSFFQALHQGTNTLSADFIGVVRADHAHGESHRALHANLLAQVEALANGRAGDDPHRAYAGGQASTLVLLESLTPASLGALLAMYEHSVYLQSVLWGINAFDQFGVELGKEVAGRLLPALEGDAPVEDAVTRSLVARLRGA
ncbi:glucose-6-phosphate isomerase [Luteimonas pelagia]